VNATNLTVRSLPEDVSAALAAEKRRRGTSLNQTVIDLLRQGLGVSQPRNNGLTRLAGTWTEEQQQFLESVQTFNEIDPDFWK
jgi:plasmid stability protein